LCLFRDKQVHHGTGSADNNRVPQTGAVQAAAGIARPRAARLAIANTHSRDLTMRTSLLRTTLLLATASSAIALAGALPASADDTATTFSLTGGNLTLSVGATATLTDEASGVAANTITGALGAVSVTDARGGTTGWVASAASSTFTGAGLSVSDGVAYTNGTVTTTGTSAVADVTAASITSTAPVATATSVSGNNTATWDPTLDVSMPAGALAGDYAGTVTTSLV
jgi:hypothetical protein